MPQFNAYDLVIFDCDGVILNSNTLKIDAMRNALVESGISPAEVEACTLFFAENFGKSRFYHIDYFVENLITLKADSTDTFKEGLLAAYSTQCKSLYLVADLTPFVMDIIKADKSTNYVASGSEQQELRDVFKKRNLDTYFKEVLGSPEKKVNHVTNIIAKHQGLKAVMIGDAISDLEAARENNIDFIFYSPYSNVEKPMRDLCNKFDYRIIDSFDEVLKEL